MNRTVMITGATSGLGRALSRHFAVAGFEVIAHGRDTTRLAGLARELAGLGAAVRTVRADITEPAQVAALGQQVLDRIDSLDVLINNAAVGGGVDPTRRECNSGGHELRMVGNYLGPYQLSRALLPLLRVAGQGRVINVASIGQSPIDTADIGYTRGYDGVEAYCRSKLALIMDTIDLAEQLRDTKITVNAVHPAHLMATTMVRDSGFRPATSIEEGMLPVLRLALDSELETTTGRYFNRFTMSAPHPQANDADVRAELRRLAELALRSSLPEASPDRVA